MAIRTIENIANPDNLVAYLTQKTGLASPNRFIAFFTLPEKLLFNAFITNRQLSLICDQTVLPGKGVATTEGRFYGSPVKYPYAQVYNDVSFRFMCSEKEFGERRFFQEWMNLIVNPAHNNINFYDDYVTRVEIYQMDHDNKIIYGIRLIDAYPISIQDQELSWDQRDVFHTLSVNFSYSIWENIDIERDPVTGASSLGLSLQDISREFVLRSERIFNKARSIIGI